jgi:hypothetical protein
VQQIIADEGEHATSTPAAQEQDVNDGTKTSRVPPMNLWAPAMAVEGSSDQVHLISDQFGSVELGGCETSSARVSPSLMMQPPRGGAGRKDSTQRTSCEFDTCWDAHLPVAVPGPRPTWHDGMEGQQRVAPPQSLHGLHL